MILSTSTNLFCERPDGSVLPLNETISRLAGVGFRCLDMSFYEYVFSSDFLLRDNWRTWIEKAKETADQAGVTFYQCHAHTFDFLKPDETQAMLVERSLECCRILGAKVIVTHPATCPGTGCPAEDSRAANREYFLRYAEKAAALDMKTAIENMVSPPGRMDQVFFSDPAQIIDFIDEINDSRLGVCWDFEHGAKMAFSQSGIVEALGERLIATHVSDMISRNNEPFMHLLPFTGQTDWDGILAALNKIDYSGAFSFEAHNFLKKIPDGLADEGLRYAYQVGRYLVNR